MASEPVIHELSFNPTPLRELASKEIPRTAYELPSPVPSTPGLHIKKSTSSLGCPHPDVGNVSPLVGPFASNGAAAVSEISLPETSFQNAR